MPSNGKDITNKRFGKLIALEKVGMDKGNVNAVWKCVCDCGNYKNVSRCNLIQSHTRSCGCLMSPTHFDYEEEREKRFFRFVEKTDTCWIWKGSLDKEGYGSFNYRTKTIKAHRYSFDRFKEPLKGGYCVCHTCDNPCCVNPDHLYLGTHAQNMKDLKDRDRWGPKRKRLDEKQKQAIKILKENGMTMREISEVLNVSLNAVGTHV